MQETRRRFGHDWITAIEKTVNTTMKDFAPKQNDKKHIAVIIFVFLFVLIFIAQNYDFMIKDTYPSFYDSHIRRSLIYHDFLMGIKNAEPLNFPFPPVAYLVSHFCYRIMGFSVLAARVSLFLFAIIFLLSMFGIGNELGGIWSGIAVMTLGASSPHILNYSRVFFLDFPQTSTTALAFYLLLKSDQFHNKKYSVLFGIALSLSFLTKWSTAFFLFLPVIWFLIPNVIKNRKSFATFLLTLIPAGVSLVGFIIFFRNPDVEKMQGQWFLYYVIVVIVPILMGIALYFVFRRKINQNGEDSNRGTRGILNFNISMATFLILTSPWYLWAAKRLKWKFFMDMGEHRVLAHNFSHVLWFIRSAFNFAPLLIIIGIIYLFIKRQDIYRRLILPLNLLFIVLLMYRVGQPFNNYMLSIIIFAGALGGYWVCYTGKLRPFITSLIIIISLTSILAWSVIPGYSDFYHPIEKHSSYRSRTHFFRILRSGRPDLQKCDFSEIIDAIPYAPPENKLDIILYYYDVEYIHILDIPFNTETLIASAYKKGKYIGHIFVWSTKEESEIEKRVEELNPNERAMLGNVDTIFVIQMLNNSPEDALEDIDRIYPGKGYQHNSYSFCGRYKITVINFINH